LLALAGAASAQDDFPNRTVRILVGFTPGGGPDITARYVAQKLSEAWKQPVIVENRPGVGGTLAAGVVAKAPADGYLLLSVSSAHAIAPAIYPTLPYDTFRDLSAVALTGSSKYVLVVPPSLGIRTLKDLVATAKAKPGQFNFSSAGVGSGTHFAAEMLKSQMGIDALHVPLKGIPEALGEVLAGRAHYFMAPLANSIGLVKEGKLVGLGVSSIKRDERLPELPTLDEAGASGYESILWFGLLTAAATPRSIVQKLNREIARILADADTRARWAPIGIEPRPGPPEEFEKLLREDVAIFTRIARAASIKAD
jgi:tripartite-type tricarboxylate transporter receptor subunit TctC